MIEKLSIFLKNTIERLIIFRMKVLEKLEGSFRHKSIPSIDGIFNLKSIRGMYIKLKESLKKIKTPRVQSMHKKLKNLTFEKLLVLKLGVFFIALFINSYLIGFLVLYKNTFLMDNFSGTQIVLFLYSFVFFILLTLYASFIYHVYLFLFNLDGFFTHIYFYTTNNKKHGFFRVLLTSFFLFFFGSFSKIFITNNQYLYGPVINITFSVIFFLLFIFFDIVGIYIMLSYLIILIFMYIIVDKMYYTGKGDFLFCITNSIGMDLMEFHNLIKFSLYNPNSILTLRLAGMILGGATFGLFYVAEEGYYSAECAKTNYSYLEAIGRRELINLNYDKYLSQAFDVLRSSEEYKNSIEGKQVMMEGQLHNEMEVWKTGENSLPRIIQRNYVNEHGFLHGRIEAIRLGLIGDPLQGLSEAASKFKLSIFNKK